MTPSERAKALATLAANLAQAEHLSVTLADRRQLPDLVRKGLEDDRTVAEWAAFEAAMQLTEEGVGLSDRAYRLIDRVKTRALFLQAEYDARYGDLGLRYDH